MALNRLVSSVVHMAEASCLVLPVRLVIASAFLAIAAGCGDEVTPPDDLASPGGLAPTLNSVAPDTLVEGQSTTLTGGGFSPTAKDNIVRIGGLTASVTSATTTSLTVTVPQTSCRPERYVDVSVTVGAVASNTIATWVRPASFLILAVGQQVIIRAARSCLQFPPSPSGDDAYLIGVGASVEWPYEVEPFTIAGVAAEGPVGSTLSPRPLTPRAPTGRATLPMMSAEQADAEFSQLGGELTLRRWERELFQASTSTRLAPGAASWQSPQAAPAVGDTVWFKVPAGSTTDDPCDLFVSVATTVRVVGRHGIWVSDIANPATDALTLADIQGLSDTFDLDIYPVDTAYFGLPSDIDLNQRVYNVLTIEVNKQGTSSIVFGGDLYWDRSFCTQSNGGEIIYYGVPDPGNLAGTGARSKSMVLDGMASIVAHQLTHVIQLSRRFNGNFYRSMTLWEMEGQAMLAEEVVGHSVLGNSTGQNYGADVAFAADAGRWYQRPLQMLASYYGLLPAGGTTKAAGAPELCTLFGQTDLDTVCDDRFAFVGASWAFMRYLADRFGPTYPGGEAGLNRELVAGRFGRWGSYNIQTAVGVAFDSVFAQWAAALYVDGRATAEASTLEMSSWNLLDVFDGFGSDAFRLVPTERTYTSFADARAVRGGSTAYTRLSAAGPHPSIAITVRSSAAAGLLDHIWVVRLR